MGCVCETERVRKRKKEELHKNYMPHLKSKVYSNIPAIIINKNNYENVPLYKLNN